MVNANKHKALRNDTPARVKKLQAKYKHQLKIQDKRRAFLVSHTGKHSKIEALRFDKKRAELEKELGGVF